MEKTIARIIETISFVTYGRYGIQTAKSIPFDKTTGQDVFLYFLIFSDVM